MYFTISLESMFEACSYGMFLHFRVVLLYLVLCIFKIAKLDHLSVLAAMAQMQHLCVLDMREAFHFIVVTPLLTLWFTVYFKELLSPVFRSCSIKAVQKLIVCILPMRVSTGRILVSTVDTLLQHCSLHILKDYTLSLGPVHKKTPMNICCHPLRVEAWMLQPLTGERT